MIDDGANGFLAGSTQEWIDKLESLITDPGLRNRLARAGLDTVRSAFRIEDSFEKLKEVLMQTCGPTEHGTAAAHSERIRNAQ